MHLARRIFSLLAVVALVLAIVNGAAYAGSMVAGTSHAMQEDGCADCRDDVDMAVCTAAVCGLVVGLLPNTARAVAERPLRFAQPDNRSGSGLTPRPDTGPPRTIPLG